MPRSTEKVATDLGPFAKGRGFELSPPAYVVTFQTQGGSAARPLEAQLLGVAQGVAGAGLPPGQKCPSAHNAGVGATDPAGHPYPATALQGPLHVALVCPATAP